MNKNELAAIVLAAGLGSRMRSENAKVLCEVNGKPMVVRSVKVAVDLAGSNTIVVIGHKADDVKKIVSEVFDVKFAYQEKQRGTGHAVICAVPFLSNLAKDVVVLCGDVPLLTSETVKKFLSYHKTNNKDISVLAVKIPNPKGYGRVLFTSNGEINRIVEEVDANDEEKKNDLVNTGIFCIKKSCLKNMLEEIKTNNVKNEIYLTDIISVGHNYGMNLGVYISPNSMEMIGVNTPEELVKAEFLNSTR